MNYQEQCACSWSCSRMCITMHGSENVKFAVYGICFERGIFCYWRTGTVVDIPSCALACNGPGAAI